MEEIQICSQTQISKSPAEVLWASIVGVQNLEPLHHVLHDRCFHPSWLNPPCSPFLKGCNSKSSPPLKKGDLGGFHTKIQPYLKETLVLLSGGEQC